MATATAEKGQQQGTPIGEAILRFLIDQWSWVFLILLIAIITAINPVFLTPRSISSMLVSSTLIMLMALLMCLPIPTTNTFPAIVIFLVGVSLAEEDGLFGLGAALAGLLAVAIYAIPLYLLVTFISEYGLAGGFEEITARMAEWKEAIKAWVKGIF